MLQAILLGDLASILSGRLRERYKGANLMNSPTRCLICNIGHWKYQANGGFGVLSRLKTEVEKEITGLR